MAFAIDNMAVDRYSELTRNIVRRVGLFVKISYKKLWVLLAERSMPPAKLRKDLRIAPGTMTKLRRNEEVALSILLRICGYLDCNIGDICDAVPDEDETPS